MQESLASQPWLFPLKLKVMSFNNVALNFWLCLRFIVANRFARISSSSCHFFFFIMDVLKLFDVFSSFATVWGFLFSFFRFLSFVILRNVTLGKLSVLDLFQMFSSDAIEEKTVGRIGRVEPLNNLISSICIAKMLCE